MLINWEEIAFPKNWTITNAVPSRPIINQIEQIIQDNDGTVSLNFRNSSLDHHPRGRSARSSFSTPNSRPYRVNIPSTRRHSISEIPKSQPQ